MIQEAVFAGGCFWCLQHVFDVLNGVVETIVGYSGGRVRNPTYEKVSAGITGHVEAIKVIFETKAVKYKDLVIEFLSSIDPTNPIGQFYDVGSQYKPIIFFSNEEQKEMAKECLTMLERSKIFEKPIVVEIKKLEKFYPAEEYHQHYWKKYPKLYNNYYELSGRIIFFKEKKGKIIQTLNNCKKRKEKRDPKGPPTFWSAEH